jgi:hypothetical protein
VLAQVLQIFLGERTPWKNWLISTLDKVIYFKGTILQQSTKPLFTSQNRVEISWKKFFLFSNMLLLAYVAPKISMLRVAESQIDDRHNIDFQGFQC